MVCLLGFKMFCGRSYGIGLGFVLLEIRKCLFCGCVRTVGLDKWARAGEKWAIVGGLDY